MDWTNSSRPRQAGMGSSTRKLKPKAEKSAGLFCTSEKLKKSEKRITYRCNHNHDHYHDHYHDHTCTYTIINIRIKTYKQTDR
jgi:deoxycytidylate deaminase